MHHVSIIFKEILLVNMNICKCCFFFFFTFFSEVTKVRRNLFNHEMISPSKRSAKRGLPRSHSVSAVEGLECKPDNFKRTKGTIFQGSQEKGALGSKAASRLCQLQKLIDPLFSSLWLPSVFPLGSLSLHAPTDKHLFYKTNEKERTVTSCLQVFWGFVFLLLFSFLFFQ